MINPQALNLSTLPSVSLQERRSLPSMPAIYFAIDSAGVIQYIGRSINPKQRWAQHHRYSELNAIGGVRIAYLLADSDLLPQIEVALIEWFKPPLNSFRHATIPALPRQAAKPIERIKGKTQKQFLIRWRLNEVMARHGIKAKDLAAEMRITVNSVSNLRGYKMPRLTQDTLNGLLNALNKLKSDGDVITPADLISYAPDEVA